MRSEFEKNRYWIGLFRTDVEFNALLGEFGRYELNGSRDVYHGYLEAFNSKWEAYARAWQHRQTEVDELQKRVGAAISNIEQFFDEQTQQPTQREYANFLADVLHDLKIEQALTPQKGGTSQ